MSELRNVSAPVVNAVYAVYGSLEDGTGLCCWPNHDGIFTDYPAAAALASRVWQDPTCYDVEIRAYVGTEGLALIQRLWAEERAKWAQAA